MTRNRLLLLVVLFATSVCPRPVPLCAQEQRPTRAKATAASPARTAVFWRRLAALPGRAAGRLWGGFVRPGMTYEEVFALLGNPPGPLDAGGGGVTASYLDYAVQLSYLFHADANGGALRVRRVTFAPLFGG